MEIIYIPPFRPPTQRPKIELLEFSRAMRDVALATKEFLIYIKCKSIYNEMEEFWFYPHYSNEIYVFGYREMYNQWVQTCIPRCDILGVY